MMKLKDKIYAGIEQLSPEELGPLYSYVNSLKHRKKGQGSPPSLEKVHKALSSSKTNWSDDIIQSRRERM